MSHGSVPNPYVNRSIDELKEALILGLRVASREGIMDRSGHLSVRVPGQDVFLINPRFAPSMAEPEDIATVDLKTGRQIAGPHPIPSEAIIHRTVLNARPDVSSVMHFHSRFLQLISVLELPLRPILRTDSIFADGIPMLDDANNIQTESQADEMIEALGTSRVLMLRGHGAVVTGKHPEATTLTSLRLEEMAHNVYEAHLVGRPDPRSINDDQSSPRLAGVMTRSDELDNPYREWPFYLEKHNLLSRDRIRELLHSPTFGQ